MYYDSIEEAINANPHCTHVLTTGPSWSPHFRQALKGKFRVSNVTKNRHYCTRDELPSEIQIGSTSWVVACDRVTPQPTTDQLVTAARFDQVATERQIGGDQVATERQIGGDHYKSLKIQPIEYIDANNMPYLEGNVVKYVTRHASKNGVQDIDKAIHYLELIKQMRYAEDNTVSEFPAVTVVEAATQYITHQPKAHHSDYKYFMKRQDKPFLTEATYLSLQVALLDSEDTTSDK